MLKIELRGDKELIARMSTMPSNVHNRLLLKVNQLALKLQALVKAKLSDDVLHVITGELRNSIQKEVTDTQTSVIGKVYSSKNSPAHKYAAIQELGGTINHPGGTAYFIKAGGMTQFVSNKDQLAATLPRTRPHQITIPARSYMRSSLTDMRTEIVEGLKQAVLDGVKE